MLKKRNLEEKKKVEKRVRSETFMADEADNANYLHVLQKVYVEKDPNYQILQEKAFISEEMGLMIFFVWIEPNDRGDEFEF